MAKPKPEIEGASIALLGSFNPAIFQPYWFEKQELLRTEEAESAKVEVLHSEIAIVAFDEVRLEVAKNRFVAITNKPAQYSFMRDLVVGTFTVLAHTPVFKLGINREFHFRMSSKQDWHAFGYALAPKEPWDNVFQDSPHLGLRTLLYEAHRTDAFQGYIRVKIEPSPALDVGVHIHINDHFLLPEPNASTAGCAEAIGIIKDGWDASLASALRIATSILETSR